MCIKGTISPALAAVAAMLLAVAPAFGDQDEELAKQLANPVAALITVPFDYDYNSDIGPADDGQRWTLIAKPVVPFTLNEEWNLISRTIVPYIDQEDIVPGAGSQSGLGDIQESLFLSPATPKNGIIWGAGPIFLFPTATDDLLGAEKWGAGPTGVVLKQEGPWTYGMLANHIWSFAGDNARKDISSTFVQPFVSYTTKTATSFTLQTESTYDWEAEKWSVPINAIVAQVLKIGPQLIQVKAGIRYWAESATMDPEGWGLKVGLVFLFPK